MTAEQRKLLDQILRYRNLHALSADPVMRANLGQLINEAQATLDGMIGTPAAD